MWKNQKTDFNELTDIQIYELVLQEKVYSFPSGFWRNGDTEKVKKVAVNLLRYLLDERLKLNKEDIINLVSKKFLTQYKLYTAYKLFGRSAVKYIMAAYPGEFQPWQFKSNKVPMSFWKNEQNRVSAIRYVFEKELQWSIEDIKEKLTWNIVDKKGLGTLHTYYPNLYKLVNAAYPHSIYPWEIRNSEVPNGTWDDKNNRIAAVKWLLNKLGNDFMKADRKAFARYGLSKLLGNYYSDNPKKAIHEAFFAKHCASN